jgi:glycosyltransferase involved in cell wall biosynthesis
MAGNTNPLSRLGIVGPLPPPSGGMANQTRLLARLLQERGIQTRVIQVNAQYRPKFISHIKVIRAFFRLLPYLGQLWKTAGQVQLFHVMANSWWSWHLYSAPAVWVARLRGIPVVVNYRGGEAEAFFEKSYRWIEPTLKRVNAVIVPTEFLHQVFSKRGIDPVVVPNVIDLQRFFRHDALTAWRSVDKTGPRIVVARNLEKIYDLATALRALQLIRERYPHARMTITGSGPERGALEQLAQGLGVAAAVTFTGHVDNDEMVSVYRSSDVMINPSLADNMPISILEALAAGIPVVSTNVGGVPYLVADGRTARLVSPGDFAAMAMAVMEILTDEALAGRLIAAGQTLVEQYAWPNVRSRLFAVYDDVLGTVHRRAAWNSHD